MTLVGSARINLDAPYQSLDPAFAAGDADFHVANQLFAGLTRQDEETGEILPDLASWEIAPDGKSITFSVIIDLFPWSNGDLFDVEDVLYGLQRAQLHSPYSYVLDAIGVVNYDKMSDTVVRIVLDKPMAGVVPAIMAMPPFRPVPHHLVDAHGDAWADPDTIASSGPFRVVAEDPGLLELERNPTYYDVESVTISEVDVYAIEDALEATQRYASGDLDVTMTYDFDMVNGDPTLREEMHRYTGPCTYYFGFTTNKPPLDNVLVRKALIAATDRDEARAEGYGAAPALTFAPPGVFGAVPPGSGVGIEYDPTQAQAWLDQSGVATSFTLTLAHSTGGRNADIAQSVADEWETNLGINVVIESKEWEDYEAWIGPETPVAQMPHAWLLTWCGAYYDQHNWVYDQFHSTGGLNWIRWSNAEFDDVTEQAAASADLEQREVWYQRAEEIMNEEQAGILSLFWTGNSQLSKPYLERTFSRNMGEQVRNWYFR
jgi:ABC-type transport system substrate-binding protein